MNNWMNPLLVCMLVNAMLIIACPALAASASGITYQGRILKPNDSPVTGIHTQFRMQIRSPGTDNCVMYEELHEQDLSDSKGNFSLTLNDGNGVRQDSPTYDLDEVFANKGTFTFAGASCPTGDVTYAPGADDHRVLVVEFKDETMTSWEPMPPQNINYVPMALQAKNIAGFGIGNLVRVQEADGSFISNVTPLSNSNYEALKLLVAGTSGLYEKPGKLGGITVPSMGVTPGKVLGWDGSAWTVADPIAGVQAFAKTALPACASGAYLRNNAGALECTAPVIGGMGTVTEIRTGTGLTGGPINSDGDIALATLNAGGTGFKVTYDTYGRVTNAVALVEADIPQLSSAGKVIGSAITSGQISGTTSIDTTGLIKSTSGSFTALGTQAVQVFKTDNSYSVSIIANPALAGNYTLTLPVNAGSSGQVLTTNGSGALTWSNAASGSVTSLTGDVTSTGTGAVATTIANSAVTFTKMQNVPTTSIVGRYSSGTGAPESLTLGTGLSLSAGGVLSSSVTDTDTFAAVTAACGNGTVPLKAGGVWTCSTPTPLATASAIVQRDGTGNFAANVVTMNGLALNNAGSVVNLVNLAGSAYTLTMPVGIGTTGQVLGTSGSGQLVWSTPAAPGTGDFKADGSIPMTGPLRINGSTSGYVNFAASAVAGSTTYTWPSAPVAGNILSTDASGNLTWAAAGASGMTALTGDVTAAGSGSQAATIANSAVTFAKMQNVPTTSIVGRYSSGSGAPESLTLGTGLALSGAGVLSSTVVDTDTFATDLGACANGTVPLRSGGAWTCREATQNNNANAFIVRDGTGNFSANIITGNGLSLNNAGSLVNLVNLAGSAYTLTMPVGVGTTGQVLSTSGSGQLTWANASSGGITALTGDITASGTGSVAATIAADAVTTTKIIDKAVTFAKFQDVQTARLIGRSTAATGPVEELTVGSGLTLSGGVLSASGGSGITSLGGLTVATQTFGIGTSGTAPLWLSTAGTHTLNIPMAATASVTAGLVSKTQYDAFNAKLSPTLTSAQIFVGNGSNVATGVALSGDATLTNAGAMTVTKLQGRNVSSTAPTAGQILAWNNGTTTWEPTAGATVAGSSGQVQFNNGGAMGASANMAWDNTNSRLAVGGGTPVARVHVTGQVVSRSYNAGSATTIDWNNGNQQYTTADCASMVFSNMLDGGTYTLAVLGTASATCDFAQTVPDTLAVPAFKFSPSNGPTVAGTSTLYTFTRMGSIVFVSWIPGYN